MRLNIPASVYVCLLALTLLAGFAFRSPGDKAQPPAGRQLAAIPFLGGQADWRQWDSFYTFVVKRVGQDLSGNLKDSLGDVFLDSRYELTQSVGRGGQNPVPQLFVNGWQRLSPILSQALPGLPKETAGQYSNFISAADKLAALAPQASKLGLFDLSPDVLRGMARIIEPSSKVDPVAYTTNVDGGLRSLLGFGPPLATPTLPGTKQGQLPKSFAPREVQEASAFPSFWLSPLAWAAEPDLGKLNGWVPDPKDIQNYLLQIRSLLTETSDKAATQSKLQDQYKPLFRQIVFAAGWQESCWRQYIKKGAKITPLASATGDLGLMQVNRNTWRGVYDLKELSGDIGYNGRSGSEILLYYLTKHAIRKNEDKQKDGNLARATYSAYNGGPGALSRYRSAKVNPALKKVDEAFWQKFQAVSSGHEMDVQSCYSK